MKKLFFVILIIVILAVLFVVGLEILSRYYKCPNPPSQPAYNICSFGRESEYLLPAPIPAELEAVKMKRLAGENISKEEYAALADKFVLEVPPERMVGLNGIACGEVGYVRNDLPTEAKKFVKRHELEHLISIGAQKNAEFSADVAAAKEYPLGLVETILFTVKERAKYYDNPLCYLVSMWKTFKIYLLP